MRGRRDGDPLDVESGLCISVDEEEKKQGLEEGNKYNCSTELLFFFSLFHMDVSATAEDDVSMLTLNERPASREC